MYTLRTPIGNTVAVITESCELSKYYEIADTLSNELKVQFLKPDDGAETIDWDFLYKNQVLTLHFNMFNGVSIYPQHKKDLHGENKVTEEIALYLERRRF